MRSLTLEPGLKDSILAAKGAPSGLIEVPVDWVRDDAVYLMFNRTPPARPYTPPDAVFDLHEKSIGAYDIIEAMLKPGLKVKTLLEAVRDHYADEGILDDAYWSGGYEY